MAYSDLSQRERLWDAAQYAEHLRGDWQLQSSHPQDIAEAASYVTNGGMTVVLARFSVWAARELGNGRLPGDFADRLDARNAAIKETESQFVKLIKDTRTRVTSEAQWVQKRAASYNGMIGLGQFADVTSRQPYAMTRGEATITCVPHEKRLVVAAGASRFALDLWENGDDNFILSDYPADYFTVTWGVTQGGRRLSMNAMPPLLATEVANQLGGLINTRLTDQEIANQCYDQRVPLPVL